MIKSTCYRLVRNDKTGASEYVLTPSFLEVMEDPSGKKFNIHFHKVIYKNGVVHWSCTEESTGLKCIDCNKSSRKEALERMKEIIPNMNHILSRYTAHIDKMREFKEKNNIK